MREVDPSIVAALRAKLEDPNNNLSAKYRILFSLRNVVGSDAHSAMLLGLKDTSALFRHEVAYCLGQRQDPAAIETLTSILHNTTEHPMVRHEAGEALGAIATETCLEPLRAHVDDPCLEVSQTCQLALQRIEYFTTTQKDAASNNEQSTLDPSPYLSVDPTPPASASIPTQQLRDCLLDENARIFDRYRAMFALRNRGGSDAIGALTASFFISKSALLKHEVAYVLGQMQDEHAIQQLKTVLEDRTENAMVRHEAAEALGSIAAPECIALLRTYANDPEPIVADSCIVALDMLEHEQSGEFEYAETAA